MSFVRGKTEEEKQVILAEIKYFIEHKDYNLTDISKKYNTSRQLVEQFLKRNNYHYVSMIKIKAQIKAKKAEKARIKKEKENIDDLKRIVKESRSEIRNLKLMLNNRRQRIIELTKSISEDKKVTELEERLEKANKTIASIRTYDCYLKKECANMREQLKKISKRK